MELLKQEPYECWITSLAMLTQQSIDAVRHEFEETAGGGIPYHALFNMPDKWFLTSVILMDKYKLAVSYGSRMHPSMGTPTERVRVNLTKKQLWGKGILCVSYSNSHGHAVGFEDGIIYDPAYNAPMSLIEWRKVIKIVKIWSIDRQA